MHESIQADWRCRARHSTVFGNNGGDDDTRTTKAFARLCGSSGTSVLRKLDVKSEDYQVDLASVKVLELVIVPDISRRKHVSVA